MTARRVGLALAALLLAMACGYALGLALRPPPGDTPAPRVEVRIDPRALPPLPALDAAPAALVELLRERDAAARKQPSHAALQALAMSYHANSLYKQAQQCYALAAQIAPHDWRALYGSMLIDAELGRVQPVIAKLEAVTDLAPEHALAWYWLGEARFKADDPRGAVAAYERAAALDQAAPPHTDQPGHALGSERFALHSYASLGLARIAFGEQDYYRARDLLVRVTSDQPRFGAAHRLLAQSYEGMTRMEEAARHAAIADHCEGYIPPADAFVDQLARISCDVSFLHKQMGLAITAGNNDWAVWLAQRAAQVAPNNPTAAERPGRLLHDLRRYEAALPWLEKYHRMRPHDTRAAARLARCLIDLNQAGPAASILDDAMAKHGDDPHLMAASGRLRMHERRWRDAAAWFEQALALDPSLADTRAYLGEAYMAMNTPARAAEQFRAAIERDDNALLRSQLGTALASAGDLRAAAEQFRTAVNMQPNEPRLIENLSLALSQLGEHTQAVHWSGRIVVLAPESARAHVFHAQRLAAAGQLDEAVAACRRAVDLAPDMQGAKQLLADLQARREMQP